MEIQERFLSYVAFDTMSDPHNHTVPTTPGQIVFAKYLVEELHQLGIENAYLADSGIVYAKVAGNTNKEGIKSLGFIAHMDTSNALSGANIKPRIIQNYDGSDIVLNEKLNVKMPVAEFETLKKHVGKDLIVTDGTTLLGADDKAGIAIIMNMLETIMNGNIEHGDIYIAFTADEEVGKGADLFDLNVFKADYAYTLDGSQIEGIEYENFNAASAHIDFHGNSIHPGSGKDKLINAILIAMELQGMLPEQMNPAYTQGYEGFYHMVEIQGDCENAFAEYIIRHHDQKIFEKQKQILIKAIEFLNVKYPQGTITYEIKDSYANMRTIIEKDMHVVDLVKESMKEVGITPESLPIRGGTDGARITYMGLPCPNIGNGGYNFHGKYEYACIQEMKKGVDVLLKMIENSLKDAK